MGWLFKVKCVRCDRERAFCVCGTLDSAALNRRVPSQPKPKR